MKQRNQVRDRERERERERDRERERMKIKADTERKRQFFVEITLMMWPIRKDCFSLATVCA